MYLDKFSHVGGNHLQLYGILYMRYLYSKNIIFNINCVMKCYIVNNNSTKIVKEMQNIKFMFKK